MNKDNPWFKKIDIFGDLNEKKKWLRMDQVELKSNMRRKQQRFGNIMTELVSHGIRNLSELFHGFLSLSLCLPGSDLCHPVSFGFFHFSFFIVTDLISARVLRVFIFFVLQSDGLKVV